MNAELNGTDVAHDSTKGILQPGALENKFSLERIAPSDELSYFVEYYWVVSWDLPVGSSYESETLPNPSINAVVEEGKSGVWGIVTGKFVRRLVGRGSAFAIKFRPGAFHAFDDVQAARLTDKVLTFGEAFGEPGLDYQRDLLTMKSDAEKAQRADAFLLSCDPRRDANIELIDRIIGTIKDDRQITKVDDAIRATGVEKRSLQRLFSEYVGVGPKWVIARYRLQDAADELARRQEVNLLHLALELGYFDQSHFIRDFRRFVGKTPVEYHELARGNSSK